MNNDESCELAPYSLGLGTIAAALLILSSSGIIGCSDHRMGLADFLAHQAARAEQARLAQPKVAADIDRYIGPYKVGPGDVLSIAMTGADGAPLFPPVAARLDHDGRIDLPVTGKVAVADRDLSDVEDTILAAYVPGVYTSAACHVELLTWETTDVMVVGAVSLPGMVQLRRTERNMLFAIVGAGGASEQASGFVTLRRLRRPTEEVTLNLRDPMELQSALTLPPLERGDLVTVMAAEPNTIYVGGLVERPGQQAYPPGTSVTILQALAAAQGLDADVYPSEGTLIRKMPDGRDAHVKLDLAGIWNGADGNITLAAGDILWVPETAGTRIIDFLNRNIFLRGGFTITYNMFGADSFAGQGNTGGTLQDTFDPLGFLSQPTSLAGP